jgi:hypothetical protein
MYELEMVGQAIVFIIGVLSVVSWARSRIYQYIGHIHNLLVSVVRAIIR